MGSPEMVPIPAASGDGLLTPTADGSVAPDTVPRAAHPGGEQQVMCVCVCVCVCVSGAAVAPPHVVSPNSIQSSLQVAGGRVCRTAAP